YGNRPEYYMHARDEMDIQALKEGHDTGKSPKRTKMKHFQSNDGNKKEVVARSAKPAETRTQIREMLTSGNLEALEELVLQGHGDKLLGESSNNNLVRDFIRMVPIYMERIYEIHRAVARGRLRDVQTLLDRKKLALARDPLGATPLHKAVMYGHNDVAEYITLNFPLAKDTKDLDGRTPLHYAAALKDNHELYNMLISLGANPLVLDYRGKTAEYYLQFPEHLHLEQMIKQSQRLNANYMANHANRMKAVSPKRKSPYPTRATLALDFNANIRSMNGELSDETEDLEPQKNGHVTFKMPKKTLFRSQPLLPPPKLKRLEINSANIKRWIREEDLEKLEGAVLEGYGEKVASQKSDNAKLQEYINDQVPLLVKKIEAIHSAISNDDLNELQAQLHETDHMVLAKDHFGMAPIHRAVLMNKQKRLHFLIDRFPETVNARDKEGRTALHYAAAMSREPGASNYFKILLEAGADPRIRDNQGRSPEYYRTHHVPIPHKLNLHQKMSKKLRSKSEPPLQNRVKKLPGINGVGSLPQVTMDKINQWLQNGDLEHIKEFAMDGYGQHLVGKTSWSEDVRQYLKSLPLFLMTLGSAFHAVERGDVESLDKLIESDENLLRSKNTDGSTLMHHAVLHDQLDVLNYFLHKYPTLVNIKDRNGRTPLHVAGQQKNQYVYTILTAAGADPMILDQKGRSAEYYYTSSIKPTKPQISPSSSTPEDSSRNEKISSSPEENKKDEEGNEAERQPKDPKNSKSSDKEEEGDTKTGEAKTAENEEKKEAEGSATATAETAKTPVPERKSTDPEQEDKQGHDDKENNSEKEEGKGTETEEEKPEETKETKKEEPKEEKQENKENAPSREPEASVSSSGDRLNELIDVWIRDRDLLRLEHVVIAGQGERLIGRSSDDRQVQEFLDLVPTYMARIRGVHDAVVRGNLGEVESVLTRKRFALSRDHLGASPLHLAVLHGHTDIVKYIIDNFPEALDGPDNEGRTPLHYAAVMRDGGSYYRILLMAGADEAVKDKAGHTPDYYLTHPGVLTIRDLLEGYRIKDPQNRRPSQVNIWQRPPTDDADKPSYFFDEEDYDSLFDEPEPGNTPQYSDSTTTTEPSQDDAKDQKPVQMTSIYPILFDRQNRDSRYLATVLGDALIKGLTQVAARRPRDPIGYLATYLYQYAARKSGSRLSSKEEETADDSGETEGNSSPVKAQTSNETNETEKQRYS
ncbi:LOW QUALITY PROTEIN: uncharacterized protein LOC118202692, partial [Stegodyphus dumicola]|uniref:LOW QUALITY PROTEIN: uncharacterized protein LOC118202692 n=1 Tax=Stegodyphus dumicola TaxID=202533 RepID=UPI0015A98856